MKGEYPLEVTAALQREFEGQIKLMNVVLQAFAIASKNRRTMEGLKKMNIMDESTAIDLCLGNPSEDKVKCPGCDKLILREECLDISGSKTPYEECDGCETGAETREKLLPEIT